MPLAAILLCAAAPSAGPLVLQGRGVQSLRLPGRAAGIAWHLQAPEATLTDPGGHTSLHHFAGPSWQAEDGSLVLGEIVATSAGAPGSIPWLVLRVRAHRGAGRLTAVTYIVRSQTQGGLAPLTGCDKGHAGALARVPYSATYIFFGGP